MLSTSETVNFGLLEELERKNKIPLLMLTGRCKSSKTSLGRPKVFDLLRASWLTRRLVSSAFFVAIRLALGKREVLNSADCDSTVLKFSLGPGDNVNGGRGHICIGADADLISSGR